MIEAVFRLIDKDADGKLDREELELAVKVVFFRATACRRMATNRTGIRFGAIPVRRLSAARRGMLPHAVCRSSSVATMSVVRTVWVVRCVR